MAGHAATVCNRTPPKTDAWVAQYGGSSAATPATTAQGGEMVMTSVGNDDDVWAVCLDPDRAFSAMCEGSTFVDQFYKDVQKTGGGRWDISSLYKRLQKN